MLGRRILQFGRLGVVWRRFLQSRRFHLVVWWCCHLPWSHKCAVVCGCAGNGHSPGGTLVARKVDSSPGERCAAEPCFPRASRTPGERCAEEPGLYKAGLGGWATSVCLGSDWVTSLRISPQTCTGLLTTVFAVPAAVRRASSIPVCLCHSSLGMISQQAQPDEVSTVLTVFFFFSPGPNVDCASRGLALL